MGFDQTLKQVLEQEYVRFKNGKAKETQEGFYQRIGVYWKSIGRNLNGRSTDERGKRYPWSSAFVCWAIKRAAKLAGAKVEFPSAAAHSEYFRMATRNRRNNVPDAQFLAYRIGEVKPEIGDIIVNNREGGKITYDTQKEHYSSHGAIVVAVDFAARKVRTIGGNESDSVGMKEWDLDENGTLVQPANEDKFFIGIIKNNVEKAPMLASEEAVSGKGIDTIHPITAQRAACLKQNGFRFVLKYLTEGQVLKDKDWTASDLGNAKNAGLLCGAIMQKSGNAAGKFSAAIGRAHALEAIERADALDIPKGAVLYFAVDYDCTPNDIKNRIRPHFAAIAAVMAEKGNPYRVGVYGTSLLAIALQKSELVSAVWINGSRAHGFGTRADYLASKKWTLLQTKLDYTECGFEVDSNDCRDLEGAGFFTV